MRCHQSRGQMTALPSLGFSRPLIDRFGFVGPGRSSIPILYTSGSALSPLLQAYTNPMSICALNTTGVDIANPYEVLEEAGFASLSHLDDPESG